MTITLSCLEQMTVPYYLSSAQTTLSLLKSKGAPVEGHIYLRVMPGFTVTREDNVLYNSTTFTFLKRERSGNELHQTF